MNGAPAFKTASEIAKANGAPYGILITTTPGFMTTSKLFAPYYSNIVCKIILNCWNMLKLSCLYTYRNRKIETSREMRYAEIKAMNIASCSWC